MQLRPIIEGCFLKVQELVLPEVHLLPFHQQTLKKNLLSIWKSICDKLNYHNEHCWEPACERMFSEDRTKIIFFEWHTAKLFLIPWESMSACTKIFFNWQGTQDRMRNIKPRIHLQFNHLVRDVEEAFWIHFYALFITHDASNNQLRLKEKSRKI